MLLYKFLHDFCEKGEDDKALFYMDKHFSYRWLFENIDSGARKLSTILKEGDVVTICMPNTPEAVSIFYAVNRLGAIAHMVHPLTPCAQMKKYMKAAGAKALITLSINADEFAPLACDCPVILISPAQSLGAVKRTLFGLINRAKTKVKMTNFADMPLAELPPEPTRGDNETCAYLHSGGTSGESKIIELSDNSINALAERSAGILGMKREDIKDTYMLSALPMFHGFGLAMGVHAILSNGGVAALFPRFDAKKTVKLINANKMHYLIGVPSLFNALLKQKDFCGKGLQNIRVAYVGGDSVPLTVMRSFDERVKEGGGTARLFEGYGLTETVTVCSVNTYEHNRERSIGMPLKDLYSIVVDENLEKVAARQTGEILVGGVTLMNGYLNDEAANAQTFVTVDGKKYVRTGDCGYIDNDGFLFFKQRIKRIIKISGISVYPAEIESVALEVDGVKEACAVDYQENGKTFIALFYVGEASESDIKKKIDVELSRYNMPKKFFNLEALPRTAVMKADVNALKAKLETIKSADKESL